MELDEKELKKINGGYSKEEIIEQINTSFLYIPESIKKEVIDMINKCGFKAAHNLCEKLVVGIPNSKDFVDLIPTNNIYD